MSLSLRRANRIALFTAGGFTAFFLASGVAQLASIPLLTMGGRFGVAPSSGPGALPPERAVTFTTRTGDDICRQNVFDSSRRPCVDPERPPPPPDDSGETNLCVTEAKLVGTIASAESDDGLAFVRVGGTTEFAETGEPIEGLGRVAQIGWRSILIEMERGGRCVLDLYAEGATQVAASSPSEPPRESGSGLRALSERIEVVSSSERRVPWAAIEALMGNPRDLRRLGRFRPHMDGDRMRGFRLYAIRRDSPLHRLGFQSGDVVNEINGIEMTSVDRPIQAYTTLVSERSFRVAFTRDGQRRSMSIDMI